MRIFPAKRLLALVAAATLSAFGTASYTSDAAGASPTREGPAAQSSLFGQSDTRVRPIMATAPVTKVAKGSGGRSIAFKLTFAGGVEGYFKPEQTFAAHWFSELASYYLDRELRLGRTPPAIGRWIEWNKLSGHAARDARVEEVVVRNGRVRGSVVFWVPGRPVPVELPKHWEAWLRVEDPPLALSPFQRYEAYARALKRGAEPRSTRKGPLVAPPLPRDFPDRPAELSDLILFDYLIGNLDRWSQNLTNVRTLGASQPLIFLDNANGFHVRSAPSATLEARLAAVERFRRKTVDAIAALDIAKLERRISSDPLAPILTKRQLADLDIRRRRVLEHVAEMRRRYGESAIFW